jgi:hypothetical protein
MRSSVFAMAVVSMITLITSAAEAKDCWLAKAPQCRTALSFSQFKFQPDSWGDSMILICFTPDSGSVSGDDLKFVRTGDSTLVGFGLNAQGLQAVSTYQIDRQSQKLLYTTTRIGSATVTAMLPDRVGACVGNAVPTPDSTASSMRVQ